MAVETTITTADGQIEQATEVQLRQAVLKPPAGKLMLRGSALQSCIESVLDFYPHEAMGVLVVRKGNALTLTDYVPFQQKGHSLSCPGEVSLGEEEQLFLREDNIAGIIPIHTHPHFNTPPHGGDIEVVLEDIPKIIPGVPILGHATVGCPEDIRKIRPGNPTGIMDPGDRRHLRRIYAEDPNRYFHIYMNLRTPPTAADYREWINESTKIRNMIRTQGEAAKNAYLLERGPLKKLIFRPTEGQESVLIRVSFIEKVGQNHG